MVGLWKGFAEWRSCALILALLSKVRSAFHRMLAVAYRLLCVKMSKPHLKL